MSEYAHNLGIFKFNELGREVGGQESFKTSSGSAHSGRAVTAI